jgi:hypothetical protein
MPDQYLFNVGRHTEIVQEPFCDSKANFLVRIYNDFPHVGGPGMTARLGRWDERFQYCPFFVAQITWITSSFHFHPPPPFTYLCFIFFLLLYFTTWWASLQNRSPSQSIGTLFLTPLPRPFDTASEKVFAKRGLRRLFCEPVDHEPGNERRRSWSHWFGIIPHNRERACETSVNQEKVRSTTHLLGST